MTGLSHYTANKLLDWLRGKTAMPTLPTVYVALFTAVPADDGTGGTEVSVGSYARKVTAASDWTAAANSAAVNANSIAFAAATADQNGIVGYGLYDALTGGNLLGAWYLGAYDSLPFSCTAANPGVLTSPGHGFSNGDSVFISNELTGGVLPSGMTAGLATVAGVSGDTFNIGVNTSAAGVGTVRKVNVINVPSGSAASFAAGALNLLAA